MQMKIRAFSKNGLLLVVSACILGGCAAQQQPQTRRYVWPRAPEVPRIEWIKSYYSQHSFPKSGFEEFVENLLGQAPPIDFDKPIDIKSNGAGKVYIADIAKPAIIVYDLNAATVEVWNKGSDPDLSLAITPYYISLDADENVYAVGRGNSFIYVLNKKGAVVRKIDYAGQVSAPAGIVVDDSTGKIFLVDSPGGKVAVFDKQSGKHLYSFGKPGAGDGEFNRPSPITINHKGEVVVGDVMNARVQIFSKDGTFLRKFGQRGDTGADLQVIKGLAVDSEDNIYVTDGKANQMKIFSTRGEYLLSIGTAFSVTKTARETPGGFLLPQGIHIDQNDTIYIADQANMRFQVFKYLGDREAKPVTTPSPDKR